MLDGSTHSIPETIDAGDSNAATLTPEQMAEASTPSPYGVWGALGSANGEDTVGDDW
jgi:hypothetical protein